jgi:hypothetical protein
MTQELYPLYIFTTFLFSMLGVTYAVLLGLWFAGLPPFHKAHRDEREIPVTTIPIPTAVCPRCGYKSREFVALAKRLQQAEFTEDDG